MNEIIEWLIKVEETAGRIYEKAVLLFPDDREFVNLLRRLSKDEKIHYDLMRKAAALLKDKEGNLFSLAPDYDTRKTVEDYLLFIEKKIDERTLTKGNLLDCIISTEFSEYNDIFLYALKSLLHTSNEFIQVSANIQQHKRYIERFLKRRSEFGSYLTTVRQLPATYNVKILVVDESAITVDLLEAILKDEGILDKAVNGADGLKKITDKYYDIIITEADLPDMNGIEFYNRVAEKYPDIKNRILFFTNSRDEQLLSFLRDRNLRYFLKPSLITDVKNAVIEILNNE